MKVYALLDAPKRIVTAGKIELCGAAIGILLV